MSFLKPWRPILCASLAMLAMLGLSIGPSLANGQKKADPKEQPEPEEVSLETKDGVSLKCTWYPGTLGKESIPVIMLHGWQGQRGVYDGLASYLQGFGCSVIVPDLRGHGGSLTVIGRSDPIEPERMRPGDFASMVHDVEAVKKFLKEKNNKGELNIEMLTVVGSDMGAALALRWAMQDWMWPSTAAVKQGQDVKALVLLSPVQSFKGVDAKKALSYEVIQKHLSVMVAVGANDAKSLQEAKRIHAGLERHRPEPAPEDVQAKKNLFFIEVDTALQGPQLLGLGLGEQIKGFIELRLWNKRSEFAWKDRTSPLGN